MFCLAAQGADGAIIQTAVPGQRRGAFGGIHNTSAADGEHHIWIFGPYSRGQAGERFRCRHAIMMLKINL
jgi:hypothetical protein